VEHAVCSFLLPVALDFPGWVMRDQVGSGETLLQKYKPMMQVRRLPFLLSRSRFDLLADSKNLNYSTRPGIH